MIKEVRLRDIKTEKILFGVFMLALAITCYYIALTWDFTLRISGARLDKTTSKYLMYIIGISPSLIFLNQMIVLISSFGKTPFMLKITDRVIEYPVVKSFKGIHTVQLDRNAVNYVTMVQESNTKSYLEFRNSSNQPLGRLDHSFTPKGSSLKQFETDVNDILFKGNKA